MKIIEKIEIKHFRSFLGAPNLYKTEVNDLKDLNIFSGANDSGKSNVLRALNLFFNNEVAHGIPFIFERDFFIGKKDAGHKVIEISLVFDLSQDKKRDKFLPEKFRISKFYDRNGARNYLYSFHLKAIKEEIKIDSRPEYNEGVAKYFLLGNSSEEQKRKASKREWNYRVKFAGFLNKSICFDYVPAIRDKRFFAHLFGRVITRIKTNEDSHLSELEREKDQINSWQETLKNKTEKQEFRKNLQDAAWRTQRLKEIDDEGEKESKLLAAIQNLESEINKYSMNLISSIDFLDSQFKVGQDLQDFFEGFDVGTGKEKTISLKLRGDGVQAKFVPKILDFLSSIDLEKKYFLWGFEEPENSAEYKNQQKLAQEFKSEFSKNKQIFITTHSEEFLQLYDGSEIKKEKRITNLYHVKKLKDRMYGEYSQIFIFDVDRNEFEFTNQKSLLDDDLGQSHLRAKYSKELKKHESDFLDKVRVVQEENNNLKDKVQQASKPLVFVEDTYDELYKIVWLKLFEKKHTRQNFCNVFDRECPFALFKTEGSSPLAGFLRTKNIDPYKGKKVIGIFDFDQDGVDQFKKIKNETYWKSENMGEKKDGIHKKRNGHDCFYAMLIPIPEELKSLADLDFPSFIEIENLLPSSFLVNNNFAQKKITTGMTQYLEINDAKKPEIWKKVFDLPVDDIRNYKFLFDQIYKLLELSS